MEYIRKLNVGIGSYTIGENVLHVDGNISIAGSTTATSFIGDGSQLDGIVTGVGVQTVGGYVGSGATTLKFIGSGVDGVTIPSAGVSTITIDSPNSTIMGMLF
jgi:hypothetical protein|tara:strand:- start:785 stop:1093 length:309 start_codon:yes stop_codon:yes gene_type:complete